MSLQSDDSGLSTKPIKPAVRPRALTLPLETPQKVGFRRVKQQTIFQADCILFKLPFELREQIYRFVLGGKCVAQDVGGTRIGDNSDPWPAYERPGGERRGLRPWGWEPSRRVNFLGLLITCRQMYANHSAVIGNMLIDSRYSEAINILYANNIFYFRNPLVFHRNPLTNWGFSGRRVLPERVEHIQVLVLDETVGDPNVVFEKAKDWCRVWRLVAKMTRLRVLYLNVDTLYPRAWTAELEQRLLAPLTAITPPCELCITLRWKQPAATLGVEEHAVHVSQSIRRVDDYESPDELYQSYPPADMRKWIMTVLEQLEHTTSLSKKTSVVT